MVVAVVAAAASWGFVGGNVACLGCRPNVVVAAAAGVACLVASFFVSVAGSCRANVVVAVVAVASFEAYLIVARQTRRGNSVVRFA